MAPTNVDKKICSTCFHQISLDKTGVICVGGFFMLKIPALNRLSHVNKRKLIHATYCKRTIDLCYVNL